ncbi:MAG: type II CAAX endopeptidase family protein [Rhodococcus sp. (in: high G+C Gram-positive bacteria)]
MQTVQRSSTRFVAIGAAALGWNIAVGPALGLSPRDRAIANALVGVAFSGVTGVSGVGRWGAGLRWGLGAAAPVALTYGVVAAVPALRTRVASSPPEQEATQWLTLRIPLGTVVCEELIFRGALQGMRGVLATSIVFGLWHIPVARGGVGTLVATGAGGLVFGWLRQRSGSVVAPAVLHYVLNAGGAALRVLAAR